MSLSKQQLNELLVSIDKKIEEKVNGGIRDMDRKLTDYIADDTAWKTEAKPAIDNMKNMAGGAKMVMTFSIGATAIIGAFLAIKKLINL